MENLFSLLRQDHAGLRAFGKGLDNRETARKLAQEWAIHYLSEENFLFPRLARESEVRPLLRRLSETHALLREEVRELLNEEHAEGPDVSWEAAGLRDTLRKAVDLEEKGLFRKAEKLISRDEAEAMARDVREFREELKLTLG